MNKDYQQVSDHFPYQHLKTVQQWVCANAYLGCEYTFELSDGHWLKFDFLIWPDHAFDLIEVVNGVAADVEKKNATSYEVRVKKNGRILIDAVRRSPLPAEAQVAHVQQLLLATYQFIVTRHPLLSAAADGAMLRDYLLDNYAWLRQHPRLAEKASEDNEFWSFALNMYQVDYFIGIFNEVIDERFSLALAWRTTSLLADGPCDYALFVAKIHFTRPDVEFLWQPSLLEGSNAVESVPLAQVIAFPKALEAAALMDIWLKAYVTFSSREQAKLEARWLKRSRKPGEFVEIQGVRFELRHYDELASVVETLTNFEGERIYSLSRLFEQPYTSRRRPAFFLYCPEEVVLERLSLNPYVDVGGKEISVIGYVFAKSLYVREMVMGYDVDYSSPLICLGNAHWHYALLCGHCHYVGGDLVVTALWGQYNHGELLVKGKTCAQFIFEDDFYFSFQQLAKVEVLICGPYRVKIHDSNRAGDLFTLGTHQPIQALLPELLIQNEENETKEIDTEGSFNDAFLALEPLCSTSALADYRDHTIPTLLSKLRQAVDSCAIWSAQQTQWTLNDPSIDKNHDFLRYLAPLNAVVLGHQNSNMAFALGCYIVTREFFVLRICSTDLVVEQHVFDPYAPQLDYLSASALQVAWQAFERLSALLPAEMLNNTV